MTTKRKHVRLTLEKRYEVIKMLDRKEPYPNIMEKFGIGRATISDIKKKREDILQFMKRIESGGSVLPLKHAINTSMYKENALVTWILQQRRLNQPLSYNVIAEKARVFHQKIANTTGSTASSGGQDKFKMRRKFKQLMCADKTLNDEAVKAFTLKLQEHLEEKIMIYEHIYLANESSLCWRSLPDPLNLNLKAPSDRVTFMTCYNASGTHKHKLLAVGKEERGSIEVDSQPFSYYQQESALLSKNILLNWFHKEFVPNVREYLRINDLEEQAILLLDNSLGRTIEKQLVSDDGKIVVFLLPLNCSGLIEKVNESVMLNMKLLYRKKLLSKIVAQMNECDRKIHDIVNSFTLKDVLFDIASCWETVAENILTNSWNIIFPYLGEAKITEVTDNVKEVSSLLSKLGSPINDNAVTKWVTNVDQELINQEVLTDEEIIALELITKEQDKDIMQEKIIISKPKCTRVEGKIENSGALTAFGKEDKVEDSTALAAFEKCIQWADQNNMKGEDVVTLRRMRDNLMKKIGYNIIEIDIKVEPVTLD